MYPTHTLKEKFKLLLLILIPILIYQLANFSAQFIDTVMTGNYSELHLAGVSIAGSLWSPFFTLMNGIVAAVVPIVGQHLGRKDKAAIPGEVRQFLYIGIVLSLTLVLLGLVSLRPILGLMNLETQVFDVAILYLIYMSLGLIPLLMYSVLRSFLDALGLTRLSMFLMLLVVPLNIFFNYSMIYGKFGFPEMGGPGAGLGTAVSYWVLFFVAAAVVHLHPKTRDYHIIQFEPPKVRQWGEAFRLGLPIGFAIFAEVGVFSFVGLLMAKFGSSIIAAHQAALNFSNLAYAFPMSISSALTIIISYEVGRRNHKSATQFSLLGIGTSVCIASATLLFLIFNRNLVASLYGSSPDFIALTATFLGYSILFQLFDAVAAPIQGTLRGYKDAKIPFILCLIGFWVIGMPTGILLDTFTNLGPYSYWIGLIIGLLSNCVFLVARLHTIVKKYTDSAAVPMNVK